MQSFAVSTQETFWTSLVLAIPECILSVGALSLLMIGVFGGDMRTRWIAWACVAVLADAGIFVILPEPARLLAFGDSIVTTFLARPSKTSTPWSAGVQICSSCIYRTVK